MLEHLENFHNITNELIRVSSNKVFISLPVSSALFLNIIKNKKEIMMKKDIILNFMAYLLKS